MIKDLYGEQVGLMRHKARSNDKDLHNHKLYTEKLDKLFDISHANAYQIISDEEDKKFLMLQQESRTGSIDCVDVTLLKKEKRSAERKRRFDKQMELAAAAAAEKPSENHESATEVNDTSVSKQSSDEDGEFTSKASAPKSDAEKVKRKLIISPKVSAVLDRTNTSIRKSTMILASVVNEVAPCLTSVVVLSKSTVHRHRKKRRQELAQQIQKNVSSSISIVHWHGKLLPDVTGDDSHKIDRLSVLTTSLNDGSTKLMGVPKLTSGSGKAAADAVFELLKSWQSETLVIGMCFDTTPCNTGRMNGACSLLKSSIGRNLLWMACRHHMFEVLLADSFSVCLGGPSTGPDILMFKRFRDKWSEMNHRKPKERQTPLINVSDKLKEFIADHCQLNYPREDYREFLSLAASAFGLETKYAIRKPGALQQARWMAKAIYSLKIELLYDGNEIVFKLTARELQGIKRFNRFVDCVYIQSWFTSRIVTDASINDILMIQRLREYDDQALQTAGLKMMTRHSWYISPELATLALFSPHLSSSEKTQLVISAQSDRGEHLLKSLPHSLAELTISRTFFHTTGLDDSFLDIPVESWPENPSFKKAEDLVKNLACVNDCAERGIALIQTFNATITKGEAQKQYLLQVVEQHQKLFSHGNRDSLVDM